MRKEVWENFEKWVGGREKLIEALLWSDDERARRLLDHLEDPRARRQSLQHLCACAGTTFLQLCKVYRAARLEEALTQFSINLAVHLPQIGEAICEGALPSWHACPACDGEGRVMRRGLDRVCVKCEGTGKKKIHPEIARVRLYLEAAGIIPSRRFTFQNTNVVTRVEVRSLEDLIRRGTKPIGTSAALPPPMQPEEVKT